MLRNMQLCHSGKYFIFICVKSLPIHLNPTALIQNAGNTCMVFEILIQIVERDRDGATNAALHVGKERATLLTSHIYYVSGTGESESSTK